MPAEFHILSSDLIAKCNFLQSLLQQIIYESHGAELMGASRTLKKFPNPKARMEFLCSFPFYTEDVVVSKVFEFARTLFVDIYDLRNVLAHEVWATCDGFRGSVLFSSLDDSAKLLAAKGRIWHVEETTPEDIYHASVRYIRGIKVISVDNLFQAIKDVETCNWSLMNVNNVINEPDPIKKDEARKAFYAFRGTFHLFSDGEYVPRTAEYTSSRNKEIS